MHDAPTDRMNKFVKNCRYYFLAALTFKSQLRKVYLHEHNNVQFYNIQVVKEIANC